MDILQAAHWVEKTALWRDAHLVALSAVQSAVLWAVQMVALLVEKMKGAH